MLYLLETSYSTSFWQPYPNLSQKVYLKHETMILECLNFFKNISTKKRPNGRRGGRTDGQKVGRTCGWPVGRTADRTDGREFRTNGRTVERPLACANSKPDHTT